MDVPVPAGPVDESEDGPAGLRLNISPVLQYILFLQYVFNLTDGKMANTISQKNHL